MTYSYNLLFEPWIPCILHSSEVHYLSIRDTLAHAGEIQKIHAELPPMTASIHFLLLAILYRTQEIETDEDWESLWNQSTFEMDKLNTYIKRWQQRFDLFDKEHPFYQDVKIGKRSKDITNLNGAEMQPKGVNGLILHSSNGDAATLFDHTTDDKPSPFPIDLMARMLLMFQSFSLGGMSSASISVDKYYSDAPHARGVVFLMRGNNLFETLMRNLVAADYDQSVASEGDLPAWEREDYFNEERNIPSGLLDFLTWQSRRILFVPQLIEGNIFIEYLFTAPGLKIVDEYINPYFSVYYKDAAGGKLEKRMLRFSEGKALWRDSVALLNRQSSHQQPPLALNWAFSLMNEGILNTRVQVSAYGLCSEPGKKKAYFYREEIFTFPAIYLQDESLKNDLARALDLANEVRAQLWGALKTMAGLILAVNSDLEEGKKAAPTDEAKLMEHWGIENQYWLSLEVPFYQFVDQLPEQRETELQNWKEILRKRATAALEKAMVFSGDNVPVFKASVKANRQLRSGLNKILFPKEKEVA